jgi:hypothetical protein
MRKPNWQPPAMIPFFLNLSQEMLDSSKDQLINMKEVKGKPYLLSDREIERCLKLYGEMNEDTPVFLEQCKRWLKLPLTTSQRKQVLKIEAITKERHDINEQILSLVKQYQTHTINKIMEMDPAELALDVLSGKLESSFFKSEEGASE